MLGLQIGLTWAGGRGAGNEKLTDTYTKSWDLVGRDTLMETHQHPRNSASLSYSAEQGGESMSLNTEADLSSQSLQGCNLRLQLSRRRKLWLILSKHKVNSHTQTRGRPSHSVGSEAWGP